MQTQPLPFLTAAHIHQVFPRLTFGQVAAFTGPLNAALAEFQISTDPRIAAFLAQIGHESGELRYWVELWGPTPAQAAYDAPGNKLGNTKPGDGYKFRGHCPIQLTGRSNFIAAGAALGVDLVANPDELLEPVAGFRCSGWFWKTRGLNELADKGDFEGITRRINGGLNGYANRLRLWKQARTALGLGEVTA